ncbi:ABC transporter ATP-binding protein [Raoultibacter massiliensis]|uniref:ABC transporter ATP-binding protein n=1 Tax=Raoultibacter massiliensis TaxID=1852371 RepID=UPI003A8ED16B
MFATFKKYFAFGGSYAKYLKRGMAFSILNSFFEAWQMMAFAVVLFALADNAVTDATMWAALAIMLASIVGCFVTAHFKSENFCKGNFSMTGEKRTQIGDRMRYLPMGYFNENSLGTIAGTMTNTLDDVQNAGGMVYTNVISGFVFSGFMAIMLLIFDWRIGLVIVVTIALFLGINALMQRASKKVTGKRVAAQSAIVGAVLEYVQGIGVVRAFSLAGEAEQKLSGAIDECERMNVALELKFIKYAIMQTLLTKASSVVMCLVSVWCWISGTMEAGVCLVMIVASFMVYGKIEMSGVFASLLRMIDMSMDKVNAMIATPVVDEGARKTTPENLDIVVDDVTFSYADRTVIDHVSLSIPAKTTCAIVGPSGSGKTTITQLIARFWDVDSGSITLGGTDIRDFEVDALLSNFSMVFQGVYLFDDTIENNIKFGRPNATHEEVVDAARRACCHEFIESLPEGYATRIGEGGATLSGGERQRISIARAILKDAPIIILDEATANVDPENERDLQRAVAELTREKTVIMIAHRLKTVRNADQIIVLDQGRIVQRGTHGALMAERGIYADFVGMRERTIGWKLAGRMAGSW